MGDRIKVTITGKDMDGLSYQETHILAVDDFRKVTFPICKRLDMESVQVEKLQDPEPDPY